MKDTVSLPAALTVTWVLAGILISLLLPIAVRVLRKAKPSLEKIAPGASPTLSRRIADAWQKYGGNRYVGILLAATLVAVVLVFLLGLEFSRPRDAALAGFAWESLLSKLFGRANSNP